MLDMSKNRFGMPDLSYGMSKLCGEFLCKLAHERHGLDSVIFRPFSGYGADQHTNYPFRNLLKNVLDSRNGKVQVWSSGQASRDWIHIDDVVDATMLIMDQVNDASAVNLGTGIATSFEKMIRTMGSIISPKKKIEIIPQLDKPEGVYYRTADVTKMKSFGFTPVISVENGIKKSLQELGL